MDILAHALWTNLLYQPTSGIDRLLPIALGVAPDLIPFTPMMIRVAIKRQSRLWNRVNKDTFETIGRTTPWWVYRLYDLTHSIPVWCVGFVTWWWLAGVVPWAAFAWLIHILVDIPTHSRAFFPTPFLWPLCNYNFDGISWGERWFMGVNYGGCLMAYLYVYFLS